MTFFAALQDFATTLTQNFSSLIDAQSEDQLKAPTALLIKSMEPIVGHNIETRTEARAALVQGRPDIGVATGNLLTGFIELKAPGFGADPSRLRGEQNKKQWENFKSIPNLIYTDGSHWALYRSGTLAAPIVKFTGDVTRDGAAAITEADASLLEVLLRDFFSWEPLVPHNPRELATFLAPLAKFLRAEVELATLDTDSNLSWLAADWRKYLFPDADNKQFADAYAQTLTYALLLARLAGADNLSPAAAADALDSGNGLLATTLRILAEGEARREVEVGYDMLARSLLALKPDDILRRNPDLWLYFYEDFLAAYDKKLRNDYGVYYTPVEVVRSQVKLVSQLLDEKFGKSLSFADDGVTFLDPAVGTGTYPVAAIQHALAQVRARSGEGAVAARATQIAKNFFAFEFLVGPYAVAHLRITQEILSEQGQLPGGRLQVYLADTLESPHAQEMGNLPFGYRKLSEEHAKARAVKENQNILVCIGNPPYNRQTIEEGDTTTQRKGGWVRFGEGQGRALLEDFIDPATAAGNAIHLKSIYNDYVYFWRWALWKLFEAQARGGIVSFITASSYLAGPGFVGMRQVMRQVFDELWIINLEGDNLGARKTENVFNIQTPVAIAIGYCKGAPSRDTPAKVHYTKLSGSRAAKLAQLGTVDSFADLDWQRCGDGWQDRFLPVGTGDFFSWPLLTDIFPWQHSGVQFTRRWPIAETEDVLRHRWQSFLRMDTAKRKAAFVENRDRKINDVFRSSLLPGSGEKSLEQLSNASPMPYIDLFSFRSFDRQVMLLDTRLANYLRPELLITCGNKQIFLTTLLNTALGEGSSATATDLMPDLHHFRGSFGGKDVIPLWRDAAATLPNIAPGLLARLAETYGQTVTPEDLFAYTYAVLANPGYVDLFWEELSTPGPRLPLTADYGLFMRGAVLGRRLIYLHTYANRMVPEGARPGAVPQGLARSLVAIPQAAADYPDHATYNEADRQICFGAGRFGPVAPAIWNYEVSGLKVVQSWLAYRSRSGAGRRSSVLDEIRPQVWTAQLTDQLLELLWVLEHTLALQPDLQALLNDSLAGACLRAADLPQPGERDRKPPQGGMAEDEATETDAPQLDL